MLTIVTCLRSRAVSRQWDYHVWLLQRTLESLLAQSNPDFRIVVVCHEIPDVPQLKHPKVHAVSVAFSPPARNNDEMCADKALKLTAGVDWALERGTDYVMFVDGDDLVSNRVCSFAEEHRGANGWFSGAEFFYNYGGRILKRNERVPIHSGPAVIVRAEALRFADASDSSEFWHRAVSAGGNERYLQSLILRGPRVSTLAAIGHTKYVDLFNSEGRPLQPLPFVAIIMIQHPDSTSNVAGGEGSRIDGASSRRPLWRRKLSRVKRVVGALTTLRLMTSSLRAEFSVLKDEAVPREFRTGGLPF